MTTETSTTLTINDGSDHLTITDEIPASLSLRVNGGSSVYIDADDAQALADYLNEWVMSP